MKIGIEIAPSYLGFFGEDGHDDAFDHKDRSRDDELRVPVVINKKYPFVKKGYYTI